MITSTNATVFEIKHFAVHDGPGIRTTVFLKGCPLKCVWCHNPEGISHKSELSYLTHKCINCGTCVDVCPSKAHSIDKNGLHHFEREKCVSCGKCESACLNGCLTLYGKNTFVNTILEEILEDKDFYDSSNGGVTLSGGECLIQADFCTNLLSRLKDLGIHTAVDTCGFVSRDSIDKVLPFTDIFLYDIKAIDEDTHIKCTGQSNKLILENIRYIDSKGKSIEVRIPYVPEYNSDQIEKIGEFLKGFKNLTKVRILPYHNYAGTKYESLDIENTLPSKTPTEAEIENAKNIIKNMGIAVAD